MKKVLTILTVCITLLSSCGKEIIRGGGSIGTETRALPVFSNVELEGSGEAIINYGAASNITLTGYQNLLTLYETKVVGNTLYLKFKPDISVRDNNIKASITLPALSGIRMNGSGKMEAKNFINTSLKASINGSGTIFIGDSQFSTATYSINGSGVIEAASTAIEEASAHIAGSGDINLKVSIKLKATISGSGNINYWGNPATTETQVTGSGKITKK